MESRWEVRRLAPSTKLALANALKKLLQKKFLDDITVKELVEECEVNRQTFYYHFQDIYDLLRWFLEHETSEALRGADCWQDALRAAFRYVQDNHLAIYHVYRSSGRDHLDCHFFSLARAITASTLAESARDLPLPERELDFLADFYMYAIAGMMMGWLSDDMREEPEEIVSWYTPKEPEGREVVNYYVQRTPMPQSVWKQAAKKEKRRSRLWLWISLAVVAVTVTAVVLTAIFAGRGGQQRPLPDGDGDNPSSIVDIFGSKATTIPRIQGDKGVRLTCQDPQGQPLTAQEVYAKVNPSVVTVVSEQADGASIGTGVIMTSDGYIITNAHVISGGKSCWVALDTGVTYDVKLVGYDEEEDLAVLKADPQNPLPAAEFGNSDLVQVGDTAYAIGNPLGVELRGTMTNGIISAINRAVEVDGKSMTLLQTNAALNNGNSGGPLINAYGQVIGINTLKMSTTDDTEATVEGLGFALPISSVSFVVNDIIATGSYRGAPSLGITVTTVEKDGGGTQVQVVEVSGGSGAADAGIQAGDVILAADGQPISVTSDLLTVRRSHVIGDTVTLTILRDGQQFDVEVVLRSNRSFG